MYKKRTDLFDCNLVYFLILTFFVGIRILSSSVQINETVGYVLNAVIQIVLEFGLSVFLFTYLRKQKLKQTFSDYGYKKISGKAVFISILLGILVYIATIFIASFFSMIMNLFGYEKSATQEISSYPVWLLILELFLTAILPAICEETAHRGMLMNVYDKKLGTKKAIILSGLLFGLMHLNINQFFYATILGFYFGYVAFMTKSIFPTMIMHFTNNAISTIMNYGTVNKLPFVDYVDNFINSMFSGNPIVSILSLFVFLFVTAILMYYLTNHLCKLTKINHLAKVADDVVKTKLRNDLMKDVPSAELSEETISDEIVLDSQEIGGKKIIKIDFKNSFTFNKPSYKPSIKENMFLYASLFMGILITVFTFIWGIL